MVDQNERVNHMTTANNAVSSLAGNLAAFLIPPLVLNGVIFGLGWNMNSAPNPYLPPSWLVGTIWMLLFAAMAVARWMLLRAGGAESGPVVLLAFLCLIYPLYTLGLRSQGVGLAGSILTALVAIWVAVRVQRRSRGAVALIGLVIAWLGYASLAVALVR